MEQLPSSIEAKRRRPYELFRPTSLAGFILAVACLALPASAGILTGRVTDSQGQPLIVLVHLFAEGELPAGDTYSDSTGTYLFSSLPGGTYTVVVEVEGYKPFRESARLEDNIEPRAQVMVILEPVTKPTTAKRVVILENKPHSEPYIKHPLPSFDRKAVKEYDKGTWAQQNGNTHAALEHYQKALRIDPTIYPALNNIGTIEEREGKHPEAEESFLKALKINPDDGESYINLGHVLYEEGQYGPAIDRLNEGLKRSPESAAGNFFLGSAYLQLHDLEKAEPLLKKACIIDPFHMAPARLQLANLYLKRHDNESAKLQLQIFLQINPLSPQAPAVKKKLADLEKQ